MHAQFTFLYIFVTHHVVQRSVFRFDFTILEGERYNFIALLMMTLFRHKLLFNLKLYKSYM